MFDRHLTGEDPSYRWLWRWNLVTNSQFTSGGRTSMTETVKSGLESWILFPGFWNFSIRVAILSFQFSMNRGRYLIWLVECSINNGGRAIFPASRSTAVGLASYPSRRDGSGNQCRRCQGRDGTYKQKQVFVFLHLAWLPAPCSWPETVHPFESVLDSKSPLHGHDPCFPQDRCTGIPCGRIDLTRRARHLSTACKSSRNTCANASPTMHGNDTTILAGSGLSICQ